MIRVYCAPLEGVTDHVFRQVHASCFPGISKYFIPFISPTQNLTFQPKEWKAVDPQNNRGITAVPQLLVKDPALAKWALRSLADMGWEEVNLNMGCPSGTVTAKGKGSGLLADKYALMRLLDGVFDNCPVRVSVKTRIGFCVPDEWEELAEVYRAYPVSELIIHPRTRAEFYGGTVHGECFAAAEKILPFPLVWNGDLFTADACRQVMERHPGVSALMTGRGLLANPALQRELSGGAALTREDLRFFHDALLEAYVRMLPPVPALGRMREIILHMLCCFEEDKKVRKGLCKARRIAEFEEAAQEMFLLPMREIPCFIPPEKGKAPR